MRDYACNGSYVWIKTWWSHFYSVTLKIHVEHEHWLKLYQYLYQITCLSSAWFISIDAVIQSRTAQNSADSVCLTHKASYHASESLLHLQVWGASLLLRLEALVLPLARWQIHSFEVIWNHSALRVLVLFSSFAILSHLELFMLVFYFIHTMFPTEINQHLSTNTEAYEVFFKYHKHVPAEVF